MKKIDKKTLRMIHAYRKYCNEKWIEREKLYVTLKPKPWWKFWGYPMTIDEHTTIYYGFSDYNKPRFTKDEWKSVYIAICSLIIAFCLGVMI